MKPIRNKHKNNRIAQDWWLFADNKPALRKAISSHPRYIATSETAKYRLFVFVEADILPDKKLIVVPFSDAYFLGILSSRIHEVWSLANGGRMKKDPVYTKYQCFDTFPFPNATEEQRGQIRTIAEELDVHRKKALADNSKLTLTEIYNLVEKHMGGETMTNMEQAKFDAAGLAHLVELHNALDSAVFAAYGWPNDLTSNQILSHVTHLNQLRVQEEQAGHIRWLNILK